MLFNSLDFAIFLPVVFAIYWFITKSNLKLQNTLLLVSSYIFYGWWDWKFLSLIIFSSAVDYVVGIGLSKSEDRRRRKLLLLTSISANLGVLGFFKYFNFFTEAFADAFSLLGAPFDPARLSYALPIGISFYTFQTISYSIDVYKKKIEPTKDIIAFFAFVSFFPQLVAGPIERAKNLLPQFCREREFNYNNAVDGLRQILWGLFKKVVIADTCAIYVNEVFPNYSDHSGSTLIIAAIFFAFQIYGDFSGYSDIAIGTARLFGFNLMRNFAFPYFSRDIAEFWRRWHISLSTWFRDYVYIPLGGSYGNLQQRVRNILIIFLVSGFWHGANWTFIAWGLLNALYFLPLLITNKNRNNLDIVAEGKILPTAREIIQIMTTFSLTTIAWVFFRSETITDAFLYLSKLFSSSLFTIPDLSGKQQLLFISILLIVEWLGREKAHALEFDNEKFPVYYRWACYSALLFLIVVYGQEKLEFIYFQF